MAKGVNKIFLLGNVGNNPSVKVFDGGGKTVALSLATSETFKPKDSQEKKTITTWHRVVAWNKTADIIEKYVSKGDKIRIEGKMTYREYTTAEGEKRSIPEVIVQDLILLTPKTQSASNHQEQAPPQHAGDQFLSMKDDEHDDLPY